MTLANRGSDYYLHLRDGLEKAQNDLEALIRQRTAIGQKIQKLRKIVRLYEKRAKWDIPLEARRVKPSLRRACRIALLEVGSPASAEQVFDRIKKRGSCPLGRYKHPLAATIRARNLMVKEGTAKRSLRGNARCWELENKVNVGEKSSDPCGG